MKFFNSALILAASAACALAADIFEFVDELAAEGQGQSIYLPQSHNGVPVVPWITANPIDFQCTLTNPRRLTTILDGFRYRHIAFTPNALAFSSTPVTSDKTLVENTGSSGFQFVAASFDQILSESGSLAGYSVSTGTSYLRNLRDNSWTVGIVYQQNYAKQRVVVWLKNVEIEMFSNAIDVERALTVGAPPSFAPYAADSSSTDDFAPVGRIETIPEEDFESFTSDDFLDEYTKD